MGSTYFGEGAFGELGLYEADFVVSPATAVAEFPPPSIQGSATKVAPVASADAQAPVPGVVIRVSPPPASASADIPEHDVRAGVPRPDAPTTLTLDERGAALSLVIPTDLSVAPGPTALVLEERPESLSVHDPGVALILAPRSTLLLDPNATDLPIETHERVLILDG